MRCVKYTFFYSYKFYATQVMVFFQKLFFRDKHANPATCFYGFQEIFLSFDPIVILHIHLLRFCPMKIVLFRYLRYCVQIGLYSAIIASAQAQSVYVPLNADYYHLIERYEIKYGKFADGMHTHVKPLLRQSVTQLVDSVSVNHNFLSDRDRFNLTYLRNDSWEWAGDSADNDSRKPVLKYFYQKKSDLFAVQTEDLDLHVNPVLYGSVGVERGGFDGTTYINTRGAEIRGMISKKIGFYTFLADNQARLPAYVRDYTTQYNAVPQEGYWKQNGTNGVDFLTARGYITFHVVKPIIIQFGNDKNFIGNGYRSLILADGSNSYPFLKINTRVWKLNYMNIFAQMTGDVLNFADAVFPKKYFAFHHLSVNLTKNLNVGLFESVMFGRPDPRRRFRYDFHYYNPIIFYRSVEQQIGSQDNSILGGDFKWNFKRHFQLYGQVVIDELIVSRARAGTGWWGNKQSLQLGAKYIDVANVRNLDLQTELNVVRPYTYTHEKDSTGVSYTNYVHYNLPLAHPLGANFVEWIGVVRYQPLKRLYLTGKLMVTSYGADTRNANSTPLTNWGGDIRQDYATRERLKVFNDDFGNRIGQGVRTNLIFMDMTASYQFKHNLFLDGKLILRRVSTDANEKNAVIASFNLRWNIPQRLQEF